MALRWWRVDVDLGPAQNANSVESRGAFQEIRELHFEIEAQRVRQGRHGVAWDRNRQSRRANRESVVTLSLFQESENPKQHARAIFRNLAASARSPSSRVPPAQPRINITPLDYKCYIQARLNAFQVPGKISKKPSLHGNSALRKPEFEVRFNIGLEMKRGESAQ